MEFTFAHPASEGEKLLKVGDRVRVTLYNQTTISGPLEYIHGRVMCCGEIIIDSVGAVNPAIEFITIVRSPDRAEPASETPGQPKCWCGGEAVYAALGVYACRESVFHDPSSTGRRTHHSILYLAGPMTGYPENNYPAFRRNQELLEFAGYTVVNPANTGPEGKSHYVDLLRADLQEMFGCHGIAVMENWWESSGARNEVMVGGLLKMPVRSVAEWIDRADKELRS